MLVAKLVDDSDNQVFLPSAVTLAVTGDPHREGVVVGFDEVHRPIEVPLNTQQLGPSLKRYLQWRAHREGIIGTGTQPIQILSTRAQVWTGHLDRVTLLFRKQGDHPPIFLRAMGKFRVFEPQLSIWLKLDDEIELHFLPPAGEGRFSVSIGNQELRVRNNSFRILNPDGLTPRPSGVPRLQQRIHEFLRPRWADVGFGYERVHLVQYAADDLFGYSPVQVVRAVEFESLRVARLPTRISVYRLRRAVLQERPPKQRGFEAYGLDPTLHPWFLPIGAILVPGSSRPTTHEELAGLLILDCDDWQYRLTCDAQLQKASQRFAGSE